MRPLIGVVDVEQDPVRDLLLVPYLESLERAGADCRILSWELEGEALEEAVRDCAGFLFTGGDDWEPAAYGQERLPECGQTVPERDAFERRLYALVFPLGRPILGICRGCQSLNILQGGDLWQDLPSLHPSAVCHRPPDILQDFGKIRQPLHPVTVEADSLLSSVFGAGETAVNSVHHQAIRRVGRDLRVTAFAADGIAEAVQHESHPWLTAVQWHPEQLSDRHEAHQRLFDVFVAACAERN